MNRLEADMDLNTAFFGGCMTYFYGGRHGDSFAWVDPMNKRRVQPLMELLEMNYTRHRMDSGRRKVACAHATPPEGWGKP